MPSRQLNIWLWNSKGLDKRRFRRHQHGWCFKLLIKALGPLPRKNAHTHHFPYNLRRSMWSPSKDPRLRWSINIISLIMSIEWEKRGTVRERKGKWGERWGGGEERANDRNLTLSNFDRVYEGRIADKGDWVGGAKEVRRTGQPREDGSSRREKLTV